MESDDDLSVYDDLEHDSPSDLLQAFSKLQLGRNYNQEDDLHSDGSDYWINERDNESEDSRWLRPRSPSLFAELVRDNIILSYRPLPNRRYSFSTRNNENPNWRCYIFLDDIPMHTWPHHLISIASSSVRSQLPIQANPNPINPPQAETTNNTTVPHIKPAQPYAAPIFDPNTSHYAPNSPDPVSTHAEEPAPKRSKKSIQRERRKMADREAENELTKEMKNAKSKVKRKKHKTAKRLKMESDEQKSETQENEAQESKTTQEGKRRPRKRNNPRKRAKSKTVKRSNITEGEV